MNYKISSSLKRIGRNTVALLIAGAAAYINSDPALLIIAPLINGAAKFIRERWGIKWLIV